MADGRYLPFVKLMILVLFTTACSENKTISTVMSSFEECGGETFENRYIVQWEEGHVSIEYGNDDDSFRNTFVAKNLQKIRHVDRDRKIYIPDQAKFNKGAASEKLAIKNSAKVSYLNWGPTMIEAPALWQKNINGEGVIVAVVDGMVDINHDQLKQNIYINTQEIPNNQLDDDLNGFVDDVYGVQINTEKNNPSLNRHGSHVAGIIAANSEYGPIEGVAPKAKILAAQFLDNQGGGSLGDAIIAMNYAAARGAKIMNLSWGGAPCITSLRDTMKNLSNQGILLITASGNDGDNIDLVPTYPSAFNLLNQINVAATTIDNFLVSFSNYGARSVQVAAPGVNIYSTTPGNSTESMSGTSMSAPMTSGAAALLWSAFPTATSQQIKQALLLGVDVDNNHILSVYTRGRINVNKSYTILKNILNL